MKTKEINIDCKETIKKLASEYKYALVYEFSRITLNDATQVKWDLDELSEAYLFNKNEQIHVFRSDDGIRAIYFCEDQEDQPKDYGYFDRKYKLDGKFDKNARKALIIRDYLEPDEDGQAFVSYTRLYDVIEEV